jgi:hypothetical protein
VSGQDDYRQENFIAVGFSYGVDIPFGELADRFGSNFRAAVSVDFFDAKKKLLWGLEGGILFGDNVREDVVAPLRLSNGRIIGNNGQLADVFLRERGTFIGLYASKVLVPAKENPHAGLAFGLGVGLLQHNIRIQDELRNASQFTGDYDKGYDRNTLGPYIKQVLKYQNIGRKKTVNYELALTITEGFTKNTRSINFDTQLPDNDRRLDILVGLSAKWFIPIIDLRETNEIFY